MRVVLCNLAIYKQDCLYLRDIAKFQKLDKPNNFYKMKEKIKIHFHTFGNRKIVHTFGKSFILSENLSYFRKIVHAFGKSFILSENLSNFRKIFHTFGKSFILSENRSCFREIFHTFGKSFILSENLLYFRKIFHTFENLSNFRKIFLTFAKFRRQPQYFVSIMMLNTTPHRWRQAKREPPLTEDRDQSEGLLFQKAPSMCQLVGFGYAAHPCAASAPPPPPSTQGADPQPPFLYGREGRQKSF